VFFKLARVLMLAGLTALLVATPLVPGEGAAEYGTGAVLVMLWFVLLACWGGLLVLQPGAALCLCSLDIVVIVFFGLVGLSSTVMMSAGYGRATINMLWQWLSFGACYILCRQLLHAPWRMRAVCAVMIGLAVCLSSLAFYQYFFSLPRMRARYQREPERVLQEAGIDITADSPERRLLLDRLNSTEPMATFALANSLAGFVAPWLIVALGIGLTALRRKRLALQVTAAAAFSCLHLGFCLLLTKSRTAVLATAMGAALMAVSWWRTWRRIRWWMVLVGAAAVGVLLGAVFIAGAWDRLVLTEAPKSLLYRWQYWQSTTRMIADSPWFGCGSGNFQEYYTRYKLPEASEAISDPHNLLLEVWSTAGTPAALAFFAIVGLLAWRLFRRSETGEEADRAVSLIEGEARGATGSVYVGAGLGMLLGFSAATVAAFPPDLAVLWLGTPVAAIVIALLHAWCMEGRLAIYVAVIALFVLTANLLVAGGIGFAGVALTWWLLLAIVVNLSDSQRECRTIPRGVSVGILLLCLVAAGAVYQTVYRPVLRCQAEMADGFASLQAGDPVAAGAAFRRAADADRFSAEPWMHLAALQLASIQRDGDRDWLPEFEQSVAEAVNRRGNSHVVFRKLGDWRLTLFHTLSDRQQLPDAVRAYQRWVELYPNSSLAHAQLAWSHHLADNPTAAARQADVALELDEQNPHRERKLSEQRVFDPTGSSEARKDAEQLMHRLRR
jgi:hypothetical protein